MEITEKELEDLIFSDLQFDPYSLVATGLDLTLVSLPTPNKVYWGRQVDFKQYGRADLVGWTRYKGSIYVDLIELKNRELTNNDFNQVFKYKQAIEEAFSNTARLTNRYHRLNVSCYLVGRGLNECHFLHNNSGVVIYTYKFGLKGFQFERCDGGWRSGDVELTLNDCRSGSKIITRSIHKPKLNAQAVH